VTDHYLFIIIVTAILAAALTTVGLTIAFKIYMLPRLRQQLDTTFDEIIGKARLELRLELNDAIDTFLPKLRDEVGEGVISGFKKGVPEHLAKAAINPADALAKTGSSFIAAGMDALKGKARDR
jgi:hypothetical protein